MPTFWPATECLPGECSYPSSISFFTLHGLWPDNWDGSYPSFCDGPAWDKSVLDPIKDDLKLYWNSYTGDPYSFWQHEYEKHGTCAIGGGAEGVTDQYHYFEATLDLLLNLDIEYGMSRQGMNPSDASQLDYDSIVNAMGNEYGGRPSVVCKSKNHVSYLLGVNFCFDKSLSVIDCPATLIAKDKTTCYGKPITWPTLK